MFIFIFLGMVLCLAAGLYWLVGAWLSLYGIPVKKWRLRLLRVGFAVLIIGLCSLWTMVGLVAVHLIALFAILKVFAFTIRRIGKHHRSEKWYQVFHRIYRSGMIPILIICLLLGYGYYNMGRIVKTEYTITSHKLQSDYEIILITDTHYGTIQNPDVLKGKLEEIDALQPDFIILGGDIVEEGTSKAAMEEVFQVLGSLSSKYGTFYVYGNHDRQPYARNRTYTNEELVQAIEGNGITILSDQWVALGPDIILAGREDASDPSGRISSEKLLKDADKNRFIMIADHQPVEISENAAQGVDLEVSGHTHAGQIFPVGYIIEWFGGLNYGEYKENGCSIIVSSGLTGWGFPIRTQEKCEYVLIHLRKGS